MTGSGCYCPGISGSSTTPAGSDAQFPKWSTWSAALSTVLVARPRSTSWRISPTHSRSWLSVGSLGYPGKTNQGSTLVEGSAHKQTCPRRARPLPGRPRRGSPPAGPGRVKWGWSPTTVRPPDVARGADEQHLAAVLCRPRDDRNPYRQRDAHPAAEPGRCSIAYATQTTRPRRQGSRGTIALRATAAVPAGRTKRHSPTSTLPTPPSPEVPPSRLCWRPPTATQSTSPTPTDLTLAARTLSTWASVAASTIASELLSPVWRHRSLSLSSLDDYSARD